jgi:CHAT domain-containing protein/Flp pilus assembly protein TadD
MNVSQLGKLSSFPPYYRPPEIFLESEQSPRSLEGRLFMPLMFRVSLYALFLCLGFKSPAISQNPPFPRAPQASQTSAETAVRAQVEKYFTLYTAKDTDGLMSLWSRTAPDYPAFKREITRQFTGEDFHFGLPTISRVKTEGEKVSLRATAFLTATDLKSNQKHARRITRNMTFLLENENWKLWRSAPAEEDLAEALTQAGTEAERAGLLADEEDLVSPELIRALIDQGRRLIGQENYQRAEAIYRLTLSLGEQSGDRFGIGGALNGIGYIRHAQGDYTQALELYQKSLATLENQDNKVMLSRALNNLGRVYDAQGDYQQALEYYRKSLAVVEALGDKVGMALPLGNMGVVYSAQGNFAQALDHYTRSLAIYEAVGDKLGVAITLGNIGAIHRKQGAYAQALEHYQKSLAMSEVLEDKDGIAQMLSNIGNVHRIQGDNVEALNCYQRSLAIREGLGDKHGIASALSAIGFVQTLQGRYAEALENYQKSLAMDEAMGNKDGIARALVMISEFYKRQSRYAQALDFADRATTLARRIGSLEVLWVARADAGLAYRSLGRSDQARMAFEDAIAVIETMRVQVAGGEQDQQRFFEDKLFPYHGMVDLLVAQNNPAEALVFAERARARALLDLLYSGRANIVKAMTGEEREQERKLRGETISLNTQVTRASRQDEPDQKKLSELKSLREKARLRYEAFQTALYSAHPELKAQRGEAQVIKAEEVAALAPDVASVMLEYMVTEEKTYLFAIARAEGRPETETRVFDIPIKRAELGRQTDSFREQLAARDLGFRVSSRRLYELLLKPAKAMLRGKANLVIVPDDKLWELPFQALLTENDRYVIENSAVSYAPSLTVLREMKAHRDSRRAEAASPMLLALGNPAVGGETTARVTSSERAGELTPLPLAEQEVRALGKMYGPSHSRIYIGPEAREDRLKAEAGGADILHFATHGTLNNASPMYSHLVLAQVDTNEDGLLEAWELMRLDLKADLASLSACETARGHASAGEGVIGLTWALFVAGVPTTVVSQWRVESASARDLMLGFHRQLISPPPTPTRAKVTKAEALRLSALKLLKNPETSHPFYWAGFVLVGDYR